MRRPALALVLLPALAIATAATADVGIIGTKHNLSVSGPGAIKSQTETQVCVFCHVGHGGVALGGNRPASGAAYEPYRSSTLVSQAPGAPSGATRICLSCHDGTIALGQTVASGRIAVAGTTPGGAMPWGGANLGTDLRRTHPVSFAASASPQIHAPPPGDAVKLDARGRVQCTSCHDPHRAEIDPVQGKFLVKSNRASALCLTCHAKSSWIENPSSHQASTKLYERSLGASTPHTTVADNGCESCHRSHGAETPDRLLKGEGAQVCLPCHTGRVARHDIALEISKPYGHPLLSSDPALHDQAEGPGNPARTLPETRSGAPRHAQCPDCHNPHASFPLSAVAPNASGLLAGVWGIDRNGARVDPVRYEYEVCFKCHGDSANQPQASGPTPPETVRRPVTDVNLRRVFDLNAPSFHPVEGAGRGSDVPSLIPPLTTSSVIYCSDCHGSDRGPGAGGSGPAGPHGSSFRHLLERNLATADMTPESPVAYALCYKCHDRMALLDEQRSAFKEHERHVRRLNTPCTACHDAHGVSAMQGNLVNNAHLVNFDVSIVRPNAKGVLGYTSQGPRAGECSLACHGKDHDGQGY